MFRRVIRALRQGRQPLPRHEGDVGARTPKKLKAACTHHGAQPGWMCPHVHEGLTRKEPVLISVCDVGGVACEAYCPDCRAKIDTFPLDTEEGVNLALATLGMRVMCLQCWRDLIRSASDYDPATMPLD